MPVDEANLEVIIGDLGTKIEANALVTRKLNRILKNANMIKQIDVPDPVPEDTRRTKKEIPADPMLGGLLGTARRQAIYDMIVDDHAAL